MNLLTVDIGSTYTKLHLINLERRELLASTQAYTTVQTDVRVGYKKALAQLQKETKFSYDKILGCSSAAGGLKVIVVGFSLHLTTEAARLAALSSGARILSVYSYELSHEQVEEIQQSACDILVLCGGTEGGNVENILHNAHMLAQHGVNIPVVVAGNSKANKEIEEIFCQKNIQHVFTENVMPNTNVINYLPLRKTVGEIFIQNIAKAKGIEPLSRDFEMLLPTPIAVQQGIANFAKYRRQEVMSVDIGGATTDILSVAKAFKGEEDMISPLFEEPYEKRSVEGDMGMRYSAMSMLEAVGEEGFAKFIDTAVQDKIRYRYEHTEFIPQTKEEKEFDRAMAKVATEQSLLRHVGKVKKRYTGTRYVKEQQGKDLREVRSFIGTGGVLIHSEHPDEILSVMETLPEEYLAPRRANYYIDRQYLLSSAGLIASVDEAAAYELLDKYLVPCGKENTI